MFRRAFMKGHLPLLKDLLLPHRPAAVNTLFAAPFLSPPLFPPPAHPLPAPPRPARRAHVIPRKQVAGRAVAAPEAEPADAHPAAAPSVRPPDAETVAESDMESPPSRATAPASTAGKAPALPSRSLRRTSTMLDNVMLELETMAGERPTEAKSPPLAQLEEEEHDPHELYLSSEEDASLSGDYDDPGFLLDFDASCGSEDESGPSAAASRASSRSREVTATVVNFTVVGRPQIVDITIPASQPSPSPRPPGRLSAPVMPAGAPARPGTRRPPPLNLHQARPTSVATTTGHFGSASYTPALHTHSSMVSLPSCSSSHPAATPYPHRKSSRLAAIVMAMTSKNTLSAPSTASSTPAAAAHPFLDSDPFATPGHADPPLTPSGVDAAGAPRTPTAAAAHWKKSLSRTLSKARKPSLHKLNSAYNTLLASATTAGPATLPTLTRVTSHPEPLTPRLLEPNAPSPDRESDTAVRRAETVPVTPSPREAPADVRDGMRGAGRVPPPIPDAARPRPREGRKSFSLAVGRRKSIKGGAGAGAKAKALAP
ncbi:hypothetical protein PZA11_006381 [Diplocarpon coronariae]